MGILFPSPLSGIVSAVLLILICIIAFLLWCMSRQKGSYVTNETDDYDDDLDNNDDESVTSDTTLQTKERLKAKEDD
uniref:Uncharacterized protein n=1 Tax=Mastacembelus armatus TaxID=205130 RepID=A0A3Q3NK04_9TELE